MGQITDNAKVVYAPGPSSDPLEPNKTDIVGLFQIIDGTISTAVNGLVVGNSIVYATRAALFADLAHAANTLGIVYNDSTAAYNGIYVKSGSSGTGSWAITSLALPSSFVVDLAAVIADVANCVRFDTPQSLTGPQKAQAKDNLDLDKTAANIASATTIDLGAAAGDVVPVTGTTTISSFGTANSGVSKKVRFTGSLTLVNSANLLLPGAANIITTAGDTLVAVSQGAGVWKVHEYSRYNGKPLIYPTSAELGIGKLGTDIPSASTIDVAGASGDYVQVTGTTAVTAFTSGTPGQNRLIRFTGALTLTHSASLVLLGAANIVTAPGDVATFRCDGGTVWRMVDYQRVSGMPLIQNLEEIWPISDSIARAGLNVLDTTGSTLGAIRTDGTIDTSLTTWLTTALLPCEGLMPLYFSKTITSTAPYGICYYDAGSNLIGSFTGPIPANTPIYPPRKATQFRFAATALLMVDMAVTVGRSARVPTQEASDAERALRQAYDGQNATIYNGLEADAAGGLIVGALNVVTEGVVTSGLSTWRISPYLPVMGGKVTFSVAIPSSSPYGISFYDRDKVKIGSLTGAITAGQVVTLPAGTKFFRFSHPATSEIIVFNADVKTPFAQQWVTKRVLNLGDSISANYNWMGELCADMGMTQVLNASRAGRKMDKALFRADDTTALVEADFAGVDLCFMLIGTNDVTTTLGSMADAVGAATFYGQTRQVIETVYGWNPDTRFVISTLTWRSTNLAALENLCTAIKEIAAFYSIAVCDLRNLSGFSSITMVDEMSDGLHPDAAGYRRRLIPAVRGFLRTIDPIPAT